MVITKYCDFVLAVDNVKSDRSQFSVRVWASPAGESQAAEFVSLPTSLQRNLRQLEKRASDIRDIIALGEQLAGGIL